MRYNDSTSWSSASSVDNCSSLTDLQQHQQQQLAPCIIITTTANLTITLPHRREYEQVHRQLFLLSLLPTGGAKYCNEYVCVFVCLSVRSRYSKTTRPNFIKVLCVLPVAVDWSSCDGTAMRHVLTVLRMTSCFHAMRPVE